MVPVSRRGLPQPLSLQPLGLQPLGLQPLSLQPLGLQLLGLHLLGVQPALHHALVRALHPGTNHDRPRGTGRRYGARNGL